MDRRIWNKNFQDQKTVTASEVGTFAFCPLNFYLARMFGVIPTEKMRQGEYIHSPLIMILMKRVLEEKGYGKAVYEGHAPGARTLEMNAGDFKLIGKPDFVTSSKRKGIIPVEVKSSSPPASYPYKSHILQLAAYGLLCEESFSKPKLGLIIYRSGEPFEIEISKYRDECIITLRFMAENADNEQVMASKSALGKKCDFCSQKSNCGLYNSQK